MKSWEELQAELRTIPPSAAPTAFAIELMGLLSGAAVSNMHSDCDRIALNFDSGESAGKFTALLNQYHALIADAEKVEAVKQARVESLAARKRYDNLFRSLAHPERVAFEKWDKERVEQEQAVRREEQVKSYG